jgi:hypothetical protein
MTIGSGEIKWQKNKLQQVTEQMRGVTPHFRPVKVYQEMVAVRGLFPKWTMFL